MSSYIQHTEPKFIILMPEPQLVRIKVGVIKIGPEAFYYFKLVCPYYERN